MSFTQFLALAAISFVTACSLAVMESQELQGQVWNLALEAQELAGVQWLKTPSADGDEVEANATDSTSGIADSMDEASLILEIRQSETPVVEDDPTARATQSEIDELESLITPLVIQERLLTRELGESDVEVELTREEIAILQAELADAESRLADWKQARELEQVAHLREAVAHLREAGLLELADALDQQLQAYTSTALPTVVIPTADDTADAENGSSAEINASREEISRLRNDVNELQRR